MSQLKQLITDDMKLALKAQDKSALKAIRMILGAIKQKEIDERIELNDGQVMAVIQKMVKQRKDSIEQFTKGGRDDLAAKEKDQLEVIKQYLPEQLSEDKIREIVEAAVNSIQASSMQDMGKVMGAIKSELQGKADMGLVSQIVKTALSS